MMTHINGAGESGSGLAPFEITAESLRIFRLCVYGKPDAELTDEELRWSAHRLHELQAGHCLTSGADEVAEMAIAGPAANDDSALRFAAATAAAGTGVIGPAFGALRVGDGWLDLFNGGEDVIAEWPAPGALAVAGCRYRFGAVDPHGYRRIDDLSVEAALELCAGQRDGTIAAGVFEPDEPT